jgi:hypothetical protein
MAGKPIVAIGGITLDRAAEVVRQVRRLPSSPTSSRKTPGRFTSSRACRPVQVYGAVFHADAEALAERLNQRTWRVNGSNL